MGSCTRCNLHKTAQVVCLGGQGPKPTQLMIIGEAPGFREDEIGKPFQGKAGKVLDQYLKEVGLSRDNSYITNVCKCRPPGNRTPTKTEIKACLPHLWEEIRQVEPNIILLLGATALFALLGVQGVKEKRGEWVEVEGMLVMTTYHPAALLRNPNLGPTFRSDLVKVRRALEDMPENYDIPFTYCRTKGDLMCYFKDARDAVIHAYDIETVPGTDLVICQASYFEMEDGSRKGYFIPLYHPESPFRKSWLTLLKKMAPIIERRKPYTAITVAQNGKFDNKYYIRNTGARPFLCFDTMLASHLIDENTPHDLGYLSRTYCGAPSYKEQVDSKRLIEEKLNKVAIYNVQDAFYTLELYHQLRGELRKDPRLWTIFNRVLMPSARAYELVETKGMWLDRVKLAQMEQKARHNIFNTQKRMLRWLPGGKEIRNCANCRRRDNTRVKIKCPHEDRISEFFICDRYMEPKEGTFNFGSTQQMAYLLFDHLGLDPIDYTNTGNPSTAEGTLVYLEHPIIEDLLFFRQWSKLWSTYLRPWDEMMDEGNRIHTSFKLHGTVTGRLSSAKPNLQNVPRESDIRSVIGSPPGWKFVEADYSQIELRVAAHMAGEATMIRIYRNGGDIHRETACVVTGKTPEEVTQDERKKAKAVNFGFLYGMGYRKFVQYAKESYGVDFTEEEAKKIREAYFAKYSNLPYWHERQRRVVQKLGYVRSPLGRKRRLPEVNSTEDSLRAEAERQAINSPVQAVPPDLTHLAVAKLSTMPDFWEECFIVAQVHDALLFEIREDVVDKWAPIIKEAMENPPLKELFDLEFSVPIEVEITVGNAWGQGEVWQPKEVN